MAVTREQFNAGMTYDAYKAQMTRNRDQVEQNEKDLELKAEDVEALKSLPQTVNVMALAEDWCGDVVANLPVLGKLAAESGGKLNVRVHLRDQEPGSKRLRGQPARQIEDLHQLAFSWPAVAPSPRPISRSLVPSDRRSMLSSGKLVKMVIRFLR